MDCNFDARLVGKSGRIHKTEKARLLTVSCPNNSMHRGVSNHSLVLKVSALSVIHAHLWALKVIASFKLGVSQFTKFRAAFCHCFAPCPCFASCNCCHDPFIVSSAQTCPPFTGFTQLAHPSPCSRSTLTTVCFSARSSAPVLVFSSALQPRHQIPSWARHLHLAVECGIHGQQNTNPANLQCCCSTEAETGFVPTSAQFFAVGTFLILRSPS